MFVHKGAGYIQMQNIPFSLIHEHFHPVKVSDCNTIATYVSSPSSPPIPSLRCSPVMECRYLAVGQWRERDSSSAHSLENSLTLALETLYMSLLFTATETNLCQADVSLTVCVCVCWISSTQQPLNYDLACNVLVNLCMAYYTMFLSIDIIPP